MKQHYDGADFDNYGIWLCPSWENVSFPLYNLYCAVLDKLNHFPCVCACVCDCGWVSTLVLMYVCCKLQLPKAKRVNMEVYLLGRLPSGHFIPHAYFWWSLLYVISGILILTLRNICKEEGMNLVIINPVCPEVWFETVILLYMMKLSLDKKLKK